MRILIQRVRRASVSVRNELVSRIGAGMLILVGIADEDTVEDIEWLVRKCAGLRIFDDAEGVMNLDIRQVGGGDASCRGIVAPLRRLRNAVRKESL